MDVARACLAKPTATCRCAKKLHFTFSSDPSVSLQDPAAEDVMRKALELSGSGVFLASSSDRSSAQRQSTCEVEGRPWEEDGISFATTSQRNPPCNGAAIESASQWYRNGSICGMRSQRNPFYSGIARQPFAITKASSRQCGPNAAPCICNFNRRICYEVHGRLVVNYVYEYIVNRCMDYKLHRIVLYVSSTQCTFSKCIRYKHIFRVINHGILCAMECWRLGCISCVPFIVLRSGVPGPTKKNGSPLAVTMEMLSGMDLMVLPKDGAP